MTPPSAPPYDPVRYWSERLAAGPTLESVGWQGLGRAYNRWLYRQRARVFQRVAACYRFQTAPPRVLEIGPGTGFYVARWQGLGVHELTGLEIAAPAVHHLHARFPMYAFQEGDIGADPPLPVATFDVVTAFDVLFHITDDAAFDRALAAMARALRPGGLALISDLFPHVEPARLPHQASRTAAVYRERLTAHGLVPERRWPVFVLMHPWADTRSRAARAAGRAWWALVERVAGHLPGGGVVLGAALYAADGVLTRLLHDSPSTELWAARKR